MFLVILEFKSSLSFIQAIKNNSKIVERYFKVLATPYESVSYIINELNFWQFSADI